MGEATYEFASPRDFEFACAGRTTVPVAKFREMLAASPADLDAEAESIRNIEGQLMRLVEESIGRADHTGSLLRNVGLQLFSKDHGWRGIMTALASLGAEHDEYKKIAVARYLQYLAARLDAARTVARMKSAPAPSGMPEQEDHAGPTAAFDSKETIIFDASAMAAPPGAGNAFERLPRGEPHAVTIGRGTAVEMQLAGDSFRILNDGALKLADDLGHVYPLAPGRHSLGRHASNDIAVDNAHRSISRRHLLLEVCDRDTVILTDLSAHGTLIAPSSVALTVH
ncbi:MAG: FHA domain-containing protein [Gammaproteobacteria bacterium]